MNRRYHRRRNYSRKNQNQNSNIELLTILFILFFPIALLCLIIKLITIISKRKRNSKTNIINSQERHHKMYLDHSPTYLDVPDETQYSQSEPSTSPSTYQQKESLITNYEKYFYDILEENFGNNYKIQTQVNLASIIKKNDNSKYSNELFRNIDFGIFEKATLKPLLLIEINDSTHKKSDRYQRDLKVIKKLAQ